MVVELLPWHQSYWQQIQTNLAQDRLAHALLFSGVDGLGKTDFANYLAHYLLCHAQQNKPCGICKECQLLLADTHPDFQCLRSEQEDSMIKIEQIRNIINFSQQTPQRTAYKIIIIESAHKMNQAAANALLKTLEEPTDNTLFILITEQADLLNATIRSRCQTIAFHQPNNEQALAWLKQQNIPSVHIESALMLSNGAPLAAKTLDVETLLADRQQLQQHLLALLTYDISTVAVASYWVDKDQQILINWLTSWLLDLLRYKLTKDSIVINNSDITDSLIEIANHYSSEAIWRCYQYHLTIQSYFNSKVTMNSRLLLEDLFAYWLQQTLLSKTNV